MNRTNYYLYKQAGTFEEQVGGGIANIGVNALINGGMPDLVSGSMSSPASAVGSLAGYLSPAATARELHEYNKSGTKGIIPGVSAYREIRRRKATEKALRDPNKNSHSMLLHESLSPLGAIGVGGVGALAGSALLPTTIGELAQVGSSSLNSLPPHLRTMAKVPIGAIIGGSLAMAPYVVGAPIGRALAFSKGKATKEERSKYMNNPGNVTKNYLLPGYSNYQAVRNSMFTDNI